MRTEPGSTSLHVVQGSLGTWLTLVADVLLTASAMHDEL